MKSTQVVFPQFLWRVAGGDKSTWHFLIRIFYPVFDKFIRLVQDCGRALRIQLRRVNPHKPLRPTKTQLVIRRKDAGKEDFHRTDCILDHLEQMGARENLQLNLFELDRLLGPIV